MELNFYRNRQSPEAWRVRAAHAADEPNR